MTALPTTAFAVLGLLSLRDLSGYELAAFADQSLAYFWPMHRSLVYRELRRLEDGGYIAGTAVAQDRVPDKRVYRLTERGRARRVAGDARLPAAAPAQRLPGQVLLRPPARPRTGPGAAARVPRRGRAGPGRPAGHGGPAQRPPRGVVLAADGAARGAHPPGAAAVDRRRGAGAGGHARRRRGGRGGRPVTGAVVFVGGSPATVSKSGVRPAMAPTVRSANTLWP